MTSKRELEKLALQKDVAQNKMYEYLCREQLTQDQKASERWLHRRLQKERQETKFEEKVMKYQEMKKLTENQCIQEEKLAQELEKMKRSELKEQKNRQRLRENSFELRELEQKLRSAYTVKELYAQLAENEAKKIKEKKDAAAAYEELTNARQREDLYKQNQRQILKNRKDKYKQEIQDQIVTSHQMKLCAYEEYLQDKKLIDDITDKIHKEDMKDAEDRMMRQRKTRQEMEEFKKAQEYWRKIERTRLDEENRKIAEFMNSKDETGRQGIILKKEREELKEKLYNQLIQFNKKENEDKLYREEIVSILIDEEGNAKIEADRIAELESRLRKKIIMRSGLDMQREYQQQEARKQVAEDRAYRVAMLKKLAEDDRLEQLSDNKRRMKQLAHGRAIEAMMEDRRVRRAEEMQQAIKIYEFDQEEERKRLILVEEERIRLLQEHVAALVGYLPKGVIKPEDAKFFGDAMICPPKKSDKH